MNRTSLVALLIVLLNLLAGCALVPGYDAYGMRRTGESSVEVPVLTDKGMVPARVQIKEIDAGMIIAIEQAVQETRSGTRLPEASYSDYRLGPGDVISIVVWGHPDLSSGEFDPAATSGAPQQTAGTVVSKNGTIYYPHAGEIKVAGRTIAEVRAMLTKAIGKVIENVQLEVRMADFRSQHVYVVGEVNNPGIYNITDMPMSMVDAINQAGGFTANADPGSIILTRQGGISRIDLHALYQDADLSQNILLVHGDIVNVPDNRAHKVFVMGEVRGAGSLPISRAGMTLADALSDAGNINMATANPYHIFVVRGGPTPEIFHLSAREPDTFLLADRFPLQPRDIVYVDTADLVRWNKFISNLLPTRDFFSIDTSISDGSVSGGSTYY